MIKKRRKKSFKNIKKVFIAISALSIFVTTPMGINGFNSYASYIDTNLNTFVHDVKDPQTGYAGQDMQFHVLVGYNGINGLYNPSSDHIRDVVVSLSNDQDYLVTDNDPLEPAKNPYKRHGDEIDEDDDSNENDKADAYEEGWRKGRNYNTSLPYPVDGGRYPFEVNAAIFAQHRDIDNLKRGEYREVVFNVKVRADVKEGYYGIPVKFTYNEPSMRTVDGLGKTEKTEFINVYIKSSGEVKSSEVITKDKTFEVGENQNTPVASAGKAVKFPINIRNQKNTGLYDVRVHLKSVLFEGLTMQPTAKAKSMAVTEFPFNIEKSNYDKKYDYIEANEIIIPEYEMTVKNKAASGYYPLSFEISYKLTPDATVYYNDNFHFYVEVKNPSMEDSDEDLGDFNENSREKARLIVKSFKTEPEKIFAGDDFKLKVEIENASVKIPASNILFTINSEKTDNLTAFSTDGGASSIACDKLSSGETKELVLDMKANPGLDPRSYSVTIVEKYDSPEYKNAEEKLTIDIPVYQEAKLSLSNFDIEPPSIEVGNMCNVMFGVNNTGRVDLYNLSVSFKADSIMPLTSYIGNIKPGETGNVDAMLNGISPTTDDGNVKVLIQYEDINGEKFEKEESINIMVSEPMPMDFDDMGDMEDIEKSGGISGALKGVIAAIVAAAMAITIRFFIKKRKKKKESEEEDEII